MPPGAFGACSALFFPLAWVAKFITRSRDASAYLNLSSHAYAGRLSAFRFRRLQRLHPLSFVCSQLSSARQASLAGVKGGEPHGATNRQFAQKASAVSCHGGPARSACYLQVLPAGNEMDLVPCVSMIGWTTRPPSLVYN